MRKDGRIGNSGNPSVFYSEGGEGVIGEIKISGRTRSASSSDSLRLQLYSNLFDLTISIVGSIPVYNEEERLQLTKRGLFSISSLLANEFLYILLIVLSLSSD